MTQEEPLVFTHEPVAETERYKPPVRLAEFELTLSIDGKLVAASRDPKLWARVLVLLLSSSEETR